MRLNFSKQGKKSIYEKMINFHVDCFRWIIGLAFPIALNPWKYVSLSAVHQNKPLFSKGYLPKNVRKLWNFSEMLFPF